MAHLHRRSGAPQRDGRSFGPAERPDDPAAEARRFIARSLRWERRLEQLRRSGTARRAA